MRILLIIAALLATAACSGGANGSAETANKIEPVIRSPGKPLHPIQVRAEVDGQLRAGVENGAKLTVTSARPAESIEVVLQPDLPTVISENRFERRNGELLREEAVDFHFRFRPASGEPQPVRALVRVTGRDGRVLTRDVVLTLGGDKKTLPGTEKRRKVVVDEVPEPEGDVIVPAQQEISRDE